jgi:hypothetical protein
MTKKQLEKAVYVNESKKKRKEKASKNRKDWVGLRPTVYKDKTKYDRQKSKREVEKCY